MYMWGASVAITSYRLTSGVDFPERDPRDWTFQGCEGTCTVGADAGWATLDTRTNQSFANRLQTLSFGFSNATAYSQYRLRITANKGNVGNVHLKEIHFLTRAGRWCPCPGWTVPKAGWSAGLAKSAAPTRCRPVPSTT